MLRPPPEGSGLCVEIIMISFFKGAGMAAIIIIVPALGIPIYEKMASNKVIKFQEGNLEKMGLKVKYSRKENGYYDFYTTIENVSISPNKENITYEAASISLPLLPFLPVKVSELKILSPDFTISVNKAAAVLSAKGWNNIAVSDASYVQSIYKIDASELRIDSLVGNELLNVKIKNAQMSGFPVRLSSAILNADAMTMNSDFMRNTKHMLLSDIKIIPESEIHQTAGDVSVPKEVKVSFAEYEVIGSHPSEYEVKLFMEGIKTASPSDGISHMRFFKEGSGTRMQWETSGIGIPHMRMDVTMAGTMESVLDIWTTYKNIKPENIQSGHMEIDDSSGSVREIFREVALKRNYPKHQVDLLLPHILVNNGKITKEGSVAIWNWLKNPAKKLVVNLVSGQNIRMQASLIQ